MPIWWWILWFITAVVLSVALGWWFFRQALREDRLKETDVAHHAHRNTGK